MTSQKGYARHSASGKNKPKSQRTAKSVDAKLIYGLHAVEAALRNPKRHSRKLYATPNAQEKLRAALEASTSSSLTIEIAKPDQIDKLCPTGAVHQGVLLDAEPLSTLDLEAACAKTNLILVLDQISDPHNVGAIMRSAAAFNVGAIVMTDRHGPHMTGVLIKSASGAVEHVPVVRVTNLARALETLADEGFARIGLDSDADSSLEDDFDLEKTALILGAEGRGLRRLTREQCDHMVKLNMPGAIKSLNVSNAAAIALYSLNRRMNP